MNFLTLFTHPSNTPLAEAIASARASFERGRMLPASHVILAPGSYPARIERLTVTTDGYVKPGHFWIATVYQTGDVVCSECGVIVRHNPAINEGVSHGYCKPCGDAALEQFKTQLLTQPINVQETTT
jgi:hypothetical protein